ncbi:hypothetical protein EI427_21035 [Flammeovirga pectinis]|uniref:Uncharacterized protein n=1 Tax=Flammeovirga pectinis TaxID=2494373 RepID=A0A3Q9FTI9_9BACT|nr:hypothetical protein [Flammeovirga pectinis]AZQ64711.1 hypothetical protein EI427_21035 [Flammeovirga pectinis]
MLIQNWNISYSDIELFEERNFKIIEERFHQRLISRKSMCKFLEKDSIEVLPIKIDFKEIGNIKLTKGLLIAKNPITIEHAWYSFSSKLDYDGWDMTTAEFLPLTVNEYQKEVGDFTDYWKGLERKDYELFQNKKPESIIRTSKDWDYNEYLIKYENKYLYIGTDVYTG